MLLLLFLLLARSASVAGDGLGGFRVLVNHTKERRDYRESLTSWLLASAKGVQITSSPPFDSYWGLHIHRDLPSAFDKFFSHQTVNSIPGCRRLFGDKDGLVRLQQTAKYELGVEGFAPPGYLLPQDSVAFSARGSASEVFARKRLCSHSGAGVEILSAEAIMRGMDNATKGGAQFVAQKYVLDVLLVNGKYKFDVRWWAVITRTSPTLEAYMFADGYAKLACFGGTYDPHTLTKCAHVTNAAVQRECAQHFKATPRTGLCAEDQPRNVRSAEFQQAIAPVGTYSKLFEGAKQVVEQALVGAAWRLQLQVQRTKPKCATFQLLAVDVLYTGNAARPWLIEINLNGYLQSGVVKVPGAKERLVEMLQHVGFLPSDDNEQCASLHPDWVGLDLGR
ncbi:hypothetical protein BASA81_003412 [Batrachochytrium salamandrivorans]|nr:hypothetical protein BASA81_003412 [Batrachochytrium salamandrivorans]